MTEKEHRRLMMKVNQRLGSEDFYSLAYLLLVPDEIAEAAHRDCDRTHILRYLEKQNIIGPHNYHCLVDALETLGRCDLIMLIASEDPKGATAKLPHIPQSIEPQQLMWLAKRDSMLRRKEIYTDCMKQFLVIVHSGPEKGTRFGDLFSRAFHALTSEPGQPLPQCQESTVATLTELSLLWKRWPTTFATYQYDRDIEKMKSLMSDCHSCFDQFNRKLPPSWELEVREQVVTLRDKTQHRIGQHAREAHSALHQLSSELIGEQPLREASKRTQESIFVLESGFYIAQYLIPMYLWLMALVHSTSPSASDASAVLATLKTIFADHSEDIARNKGTLGAIFGEEVMFRVSQELLQDKKDRDLDSSSGIDTTIHSSIVRAISIVWHVGLILLAMMSMKCKVDLRTVQQRLAEFIVSQRINLMQTYFCLSKKFTEGMQREVDHYKEICEQKISQLVGGASEPLEMVQSLLNYKTK